MKRLLVVALMGLALTGCDNKQQTSKFTCTAANAQVMSLNVRAFPDAIKVNGVTFHPFDAGRHENGVYETQFIGNMDGRYQSFFITKYDHPYFHAIKYLATSGNAIISFSERVKYAWIIATSHFTGSYSNNGGEVNADDMTFYAMPCNPSQVDL